MIREYHLYREDGGEELIIEDESVVKCRMELRIETMIVMLACVLLSDSASMGAHFHESFGNSVQTYSDSRIRLASPEWNYHIIIIHDTYSKERY